MVKEFTDFLKEYGVIGLTIAVIIGGKLNEFVSSLVNDLMMPLIFTVFMVSLPSGLTLYMWIGAIFGVCQQMYFMREKKPLQVAA